MTESFHVFLLLSFHVGVKAGLTRGMCVAILLMFQRQLVLGEVIVTGCAIVTRSALESVRLQHYSVDVYLV